MALSMSPISDSFDELRKHAGSNHSQKARLNVVLAAVEEIICERNGNSDIAMISSTDYFAAFMTALEGGELNNMEDILALMVMIIQYVPTAPLRAKFKLISSIFLNIGQTLQHFDQTINQENQNKTSMIKNLIQCFSHILKVQETSANAWASPSCLKSFDYLLSYINDSRPKIRKSAHSAIFQVLQAHYNHNPSSVIISKVSDICIDILGDKKQQQNNQTSMILHYLSLIQEIAYMISKAKATIISSLILQLQSENSNSILLNNCNHVILKIMPKLSLDFLLNEMMRKYLLSNIPSTTNHQNHQGYEKISNYNNLLSMCVNCIYDLNEKECYQILPKSISILLNFCESTVHPEIVSSAINNIDSILAKCLTLHLFHSNGKSDKKVLSEVLIYMASLLEYRFQTHWALLLPKLGNIFQRIYLELNQKNQHHHFNTHGGGGGDSHVIKVVPILKGLVGLHDALEANPAAAPAGTLEVLEEATCQAAACLGPHVFLLNIPLGNHSSVIANNRLWCLTVLRQSIKLSASLSLTSSSSSFSSSSSLGHFQDIILPMIEHFDAEIHNEENIQNAPVMVKNSQSKLFQLWSLLPAYCLHPHDIDQVLPALLPVLTKALKDPSSQLTTCHSIKTLVSGDMNSPATSSSSLLEEGGDVFSKKTSGSVVSIRDFSESEQVTMATMAKKLLPILFKLLDEGVKESSVLSILETTTALSKCAQPSFVNVLFKTLLQKLLQVTLTSSSTSSSAAASTSANKIVIFCDLAISLIPVLEDSAILLLYNAIKPMISMDENPAFQKRCYRILHMLCDHHPQFTLEEVRVNELLSLLTGSLLTCHVSSRTMRLRCLISITSKFDANNAQHMEEFIPNMLGEVMLCTKDSNAKAREASYDLLLTMNETMDNNVKFIEIVIAGLGARTPHMRSAAVMSLSHLLYFNAPKDDQLKNYIPELLSTVLVLLHEQAREVIKSVISFIRISIAVADPEQLRPLLPDIVNGVMKWAGESKNRFRAKIKLIMKKLCRLYGFETLSSILPEEDQPLISYLHRMAGRSSRKREQGLQADQSESKVGSAGKKSIEEMLDDDSEEEADEDGIDDEVEDDDDDDDDEEEEQVMFQGDGGSDGVKKRQHGEFVMQDHDEDGGVVDLLDSSLLRHVKVDGKKPNNQSEASLANPYADVTFAADGRLIIPKFSESSTSAPQPKRKRDNQTEQNDHQTSASSSSLNTANSMMARKKKQQERMKNNPNKAKNKKIAGSEYKSKKGAGGDVKRAGQLEPYAYIPLDGKALANKKSKATVEQYADVLFGGNAKGGKQKANSTNKAGGRKKGRR